MWLAAECTRVTTYRPSRVNYIIPIMQPIRMIKLHRIA
jgi:hypothetical protein